MVVTNQRTTAYSASLKSVNVCGEQGKELFITLRTKNGDWKRVANGGCEFCGVGNLDREWPSLGNREARLQVEGTIQELRSRGEDLGVIRKVSLISMSDGLLNAPWTIGLVALKRAIETIARNFLNIRIISVESRADHAMDFRTLTQVGAHIDSVFGQSILKEVACGIETPYEEVRNRIRKGISDRVLGETAIALSRNGWNRLRGYFIYNMFEHDPVTRVQALKQAVDFMRSLNSGLPIETSMLVLRGYVPPSKAHEPLFCMFEEVNDVVALRELRAAAEYARKRSFLFEIDPTTNEDQIAVAAFGVMSPQYQKALNRYNLTLDPAQLVLTFRAKKSPSLP